MTVWLAGAVVIVLAIAICALMVVRAKRITDCFVALQMAGVLSVLALMILAQAMHRPSFYDLALTLALLSFPAALMFSHFLEIWLR